jgi:hypothetical protein
VYQLLHQVLLLLMMMMMMMLVMVILVVVVVVMVMVMAAEMCAAAAARHHQRLPGHHRQPQTPSHAQSVERALLAGVAVSSEAVAAPAAAAAVPVVAAWLHAGPTNHPEVHCHAHHQTAQPAHQAVQRRQQRER